MKVLIQEKKSFGQGGEFSVKDWFSGRSISYLEALEYDLKK